MVMNHWDLHLTNKLINKQYYYYDTNTHTHTHTEKKNVFIFNDNKKIKTKNLLFIYRLFFVQTYFQYVSDIFQI